MFARMRKLRTPAPPLVPREAELFFTFFDEISLLCYDAFGSRQHALSVHSEGGSAMSNFKKLEALLPGYQGPFFPPCIEALQQELYVKNDLNFSGFILVSIAGKIPGFRKMERPRTSDDYWWFWSMNFETSKTKIAILFPWSQDFRREDGTSSDHHIALYTNGKNESDDDIERIVKQILDAYKSWSQEMQQQEEERKAAAK